MKPSLFRSPNLFIILLSVFFITCEKENQVLKVKDLNFMGCDKSKGLLASTACTKFETEGKNYLRITRSGILLNCAVDSISVSIYNNNGKVNVSEQDHAKSAAFCNCAMTYSYSVGPLDNSNHIIQIQGCKGELIEFNYSGQAAIVEICR